MYIYITVITLYNGSPCDNLVFAWEFVFGHAANSHGMFRRFRKQFVDVRFSVRNPLLPLRKDDPMNVRWRVHHLGGYMAGGLYIVNFQF